MQGYGAGTFIPRLLAGSKSWEIKIPTSNDLPSGVMKRGNGEKKPIFIDGYQMDVLMGQSSIHGESFQ